MITGLKSLVEFYSINSEIIMNNRVVFIMFALICGGITFAACTLVYKQRSAYKNEKYEKACDKIKELDSKVKLLSEENELLRKKLAEVDEIPQLMAGMDDNYKSASAKMISDELKKMQKPT